MPKFRVTTGTPGETPDEVEAPDWAKALTNVLGRFGVGKKAIRVDVDKEGTTDLWEEDSGIHYRMDIDPDTSFDLGDDPTTDLWDAPTPGSGFSQAATPSMEDQGKIDVQIASILQASTDDDAYEQALTLLLTHIPAESGSILIASGDELNFVCARGPKADQLVGRSMSSAEGIAGAVCQSQSALLIRGVRKNPQHYRDVDRDVNYVTLTLLAVPIINEKQSIGVVELLNPLGSDTFTGWHQGFTRSVCDTLGDRLCR
jgi:GAF domain-containing protein